MKKQIFILAVFCIALFSCKNNNDVESIVTVKLLPVLTTNETTLITQNSAKSGGNISSDNGFEVTVRGVCWSLKPNPTIKDSLTKDAAGTGAFTSSIKNLLADTTYYVRAYATNKDGTAYGLQVTFKTLAITDVDGNIYHTVKIGSQTWMVENLKTTKYNDGKAIPNVTDNTAWVALSTPAYCWSNNDATYKNKYGALYNWYAVNTGKLAPTGWHIPTDAEWTTLTDYVTANLGTSLNAAKALAATTDWNTHGTTGTVGCNLILNNSTGFSALPGGYRQYSGGSFSPLGYYDTWWSATEDNTNYAWYRIVGYSFSNVLRDYSGKGSGFSVRCIKD